MNQQFPQDQLLSPIATYSGGNQRAEIIYRYQKGQNSKRGAHSIGIQIYSDFLIAKWSSSVIRISPHTFSPISIGS